MKALKNMWLIGDVFLKDMYHSLHALKSFDSNNKANDMYIYAYYNIIPSYGEFNVKGNAMLNVLNAFIEAMNVNVHLPRFVILIPDRKLIQLAQSADLKGNFLEILEKFIEWMVTHCNRAIQYKKEDLKTRRVGAVELLDPKLIWVALVELSDTSSEKATKARRFNSLLEDILTSFRNNFIIHPFGRNAERSLFDRSSTLNHEGRVAYWRYLNSAIRSFDEQKISLKPYKLSEINAKSQMTSGQNNRALQNQTTRADTARFLLPRPPARKLQYAKPDQN